MNWEKFVVVDKDGNPIKQDFKNRFSEKCRECFKWMSENKEITIAIASVVSTTIVCVTRTIAKRNSLNREVKVKEFYCYDRSLGHHWELRRKLTNKEWLDINARKKAGENLADILESLHVLK